MTEQDASRTSDAWKLFQWMLLAWLWLAGTGALTISLELGKVTVLLVGIPVSLALILVGVNEVRYTDGDSY